MGGQGGLQLLYLKLRWEAATLCRARLGEEYDVETLVYGALNFALTAQALEEWVWIEVLKQRGRTAIAKDQFRREVDAAVPMQGAFRDIANTTKHGAYRDENWAGGRVELVHFPAFVDNARAFVLIYSSEESTAQTNLNLFDDAVQDWLRYLLSQQLIAA